MSEKPVWERRSTRRPGEGIISAVSVGAVFILIGLVFVLALPNNLWDKTLAFFSSFTGREIPGISISLPAPSIPSAHAVFYTALFQFSLGLAFLQTLILALRLGLRLGDRRTAETIGNLVFWFGASYLEHLYLNNSTTATMWFEFWAALIIVVGLSFVARAVVLLAKR